MNQVCAAQIREWFDAYVDRFKTDGALLPMQQLKLRHSLHVADDAAGIAADLGWGEHELRVARVAGLLHDVGRFSQFAEYGTFDDPASVNHAERGYEVLTGDDAPLALSACSGLDRRRILASVRYHNRLHVPSLEGDMRQFLLLVRDADKLDIYRVVYEPMVEGDIEAQSNIVWGKPLQGGVNPAMVATIRGASMGSYTDVKSLADYLLLQVSWVFDIHFAPVMARIRERHLLERLRAFLPMEAPGVAEAIDVAIAHRDAVLAGKAGP